MSDHPDTPLSRLAGHLDGLRKAAGAPSAHEISRRLGKMPSNSTVSTMLNGKSLVSLANVLKVSGLLGGDPAVTLDLWNRADAATTADTEPDIIRCTPGKLGRNCVLPQAVDDQWVPRGLLGEMARDGRSLSDVGDQRDPLLRQELVRSLITARRIVINRSFLVRNPVLSRAYRDEPEEREAFTTLLSGRVIVPYLYKESTPLESEFANEPGARQAQEVWNEILRSKVVMCVRLSWDQDKNAAATDRLEESFGQRVQQAADSSIGMLLKDTVGSADREDELREELRQLVGLGKPGKAVRLSRTGLYKKYIVQPDTDPRNGAYDFGNPSMIPLKWILDLVYNSNLAARLRIALTTPADSAHRSVVHHPHFLQSAGRRGSYDPGRVRITIQEAIQHFSIGDLAVFAGKTLADVVDIRAEPVWERYDRSVDALLKEPWLMSHPERGLPHVHARYQDLIHHIRRRS